MSAVALLTGICCADVEVKQQGMDYVVTAPGYKATVSATDGSLTNLTIGGQIFIDLGPVEGVRGTYFFQGAIVPMPAVAQPEPKVITASSDKAAVRYELDERAMTWTLTNKTAAENLFIMVMPSGVEMVTNEAGTTLPLPITQPWTTVTFARGGSRLTIRNISKIWSWIQNSQVIEVTLAPNESRKLVFEMTTSEQPTPAKTPPPRPAPLDEHKPASSLWDLQKLAQPPQTYPAPEISEPGLRALYFEGLPYKGKPTRVFAWYGAPSVKEGEKVPAMVLVHGGGGTAYANWVRTWNARGYAAIVFDSNGRLPRGMSGTWETHQWAGPAGIVADAPTPFAQATLPIEDQWTYHAVADALLAHSLIRLFPEVDASRIGITGVSWGGYLTNIIAGIDHRFRFAVPVYGSGFLADNSTWRPELDGLGPAHAERWRRLWEPSMYLSQAWLPMLWVTGTNDFAYPLDSLQKSYRLAAGESTLSIRVRMGHSHGPVSENPEEIHVFANSIVKGGTPLLRFVDQGLHGNTAWASFEIKIPVKQAELVYTTSTGKWPDRLWQAMPAKVEGNRITASLPVGTTVYYFNTTDERNLIVSSEHRETGGIPAL